MGHSKQHRRKNNSQSARSAGASSLVCSSGKIAWDNRRGAKSAAAQKRHEGSMRPYRCGECGCWHIGHLPSAVVFGVTSAADFYRGREGVV